MRRIVAIGVLAASLALAGCVTNGTGSGTATPTPTTSAGQQAAAIIGKVQSTTAQICKFVPTAQTVANILASLGVSSASQLTDVATQICSAVGPAGSLKARRGVPTVAGVPVRGTRVR